MGTKLCWTKKMRPDSRKKIEPERINKKVHINKLHLYMFMFLQLLKDIKLHKVIL